LVISSHRRAQNRGEFDPTTQPGFLPFQLTMCLPESAAPVCEAMSDFEGKGTAGDLWLGKSSHCRLALLERDLVASRLRAMAKYFSAAWRSASLVVQSDERARLRAASAIAR